MYEQRESTVSVARYLNDHDIATKRGGRWTSKRICDIIHNPFYYGTLRYNYRETAGGKIKSSDEWIIKENNHQGIISKEQWDKCNKIMETNAINNSSRWRKKNSVQHIFGDILFCNNCGHRMVCSLDKPRKSDGYRPTRYVCSGKMKGFVCDNSIVTDITIGDFLLQYVLNFINCINHLPGSIEQLDKQLLSGSYFKGVYLDYDSLYDTYAMLRYVKNMKKNRYEYKDLDNIIDFNKVKANKSEIESLMDNKNKLERAAERLTNLYLFADEKMPEREYYKRKKEIEDKINDINSKLDAI